ncbi:hypothetical protein Acr_05g0013210 [Actinidia rufa]|uniref:Uncharacterized protein n=1 Tax=Actinidia rufa TaxID=165716 RepID=A0A7J0EMZ4_9ERIC|nr:hypothetical protein Acr_05g0013210 [Actinidia rufa]
MEMGDLVKKSKSKGSISQKGKGKEKESTNLEYDATRFTEKIEEKFYNRVWVRNGEVIEREFDLNFFKDLGFGYLQNFTNRGWLNLASFKVESILNLCQEFMSNIKHRPVTQKGKERMISWVKGKKLRVTPNTFAEIFEIPRVENPEFEFLDVGMPDLPTISHLIRTESEKPIDRYSLTQSEGKRLKMQLDENASEQPSVGIPELQEAITNLRIEFDTRMTSLEEQSGRHITMLQEIKRMLIRMQSKDDDDDEEED